MPVADCCLSSIDLLFFFCSTLALMDLVKWYLKGRHPLYSCPVVWPCNRWWRKQRSRRGNWYPSWRHRRRVLAYKLLQNIDSNSYSLVDSQRLSTCKRCCCTGCNCQGQSVNPLQDRRRKRFESRHRSKPKIPINISSHFPRSFQSHHRHSSENEHVFVFLHN